jgi:Xaa-Pro aminopeptidase
MSGRPLRAALVSVSFGAWFAVAAVTARAQERPNRPDARGGDGPEPLPAEVLEERRAAFIELMEPGIAVLRSADIRSEEDHPQDSDFRQVNDFYYLTGLETPRSWLVLLKPLGRSASVTLYLPQANPGQERWTGRGITVEEAAQTSGIAAVRPAEDFPAEADSLLSRRDSAAGYEMIYLPFGRGKGTQHLADLAQQAGFSVADVSGRLASLRLVKGPIELSRLRRAVAITVEALREAMQAAQPGMYEYELEAIIEFVFRSRGAERVGFPSVVGSGPNSVILHYDGNRSSDLVVMDVGAEFGYYTADITRTIPVSGKFSDRQREIYQLVLSTQETVIDSVRPGITIRELDRIAREYMREHSGDLCGERSCDSYFVHSIGHWLGMAVHDVGSYGVPLEPGMVLTVEPGIYLPHENLGVRIEDDLLVTEDGCEVLSAALPKSVDSMDRRR